jgi:hypothetical protein
MLAESTVRARAKRAGFSVRKSRRRSRTPSNCGEYMLLEQGRAIPILGWHYDATLDDIDQYLRDVD